MKAIGQLLYFAVVAVVIGAPAYAITARSSPNSLGTPAKGVAKLEQRTFVREENKPEPDRRPVWIMPTKEYKMAPPVVAPRLAQSSSRDSNRARKVVQKNVRPPNASDPNYRTTMSYAEEPVRKMQFGFNGWRDYR